MDFKPNLGFVFEKIYTPVILVGELWVCGSGLHLLLQTTGSERDRREKRPLPAGATAH